MADDRSSSSQPFKEDAKVIFLHHSTGGVIWKGGVKGVIDKHNEDHGTGYSVEERAFPSGGYPWANYPYDYWNIWINHAGNEPYRGQDTLEILTEAYDVVVLKHCFPVSDLEPDSGSPQVTSDVKSLETYKLQYQALKAKLHAFPDTRFLVWTGAALTKASTTKASAERAKEFFDWVRTSWDEAGDNIFVWDFFNLQTDGGLYLRDEHAANPYDSHPSPEFAARVAPLFAYRIIEVIEGRGDGE